MRIRLRAEILKMFYDGQGIVVNMVGVALYVRVDLGSCDYMEDG